MGEGNKHPGLESRYWCQDDQDRIGRMSSIFAAMRKSLDQIQNEFNWFEEEFKYFSRLKTPLMDASMDMFDESPHKFGCDLMDEANSTPKHVHVEGMEKNHGQNDPHYPTCWMILFLIIIVIKMRFLM